MDTLCFNAHKHIYIHTHIGTHTLPKETSICITQAKNIIQMYTHLLTLKSTKTINPNEEKLRNLLSRKASGDRRSNWSL